MYARVPTFDLGFVYPVQIMGKAQKPQRNFSELIDDLERIREELLTIQRSMERLEPQPTAIPDEEPTRRGSLVKT